MELTLDLKSNDPRLHSMPCEDIGAVISQAKAALARCRLSVAGLGGVNRIAQRLEIVIERLQAEALASDLDDWRPRRHAKYQAQKAGSMRTEWRTQ